MPRKLILRVLKLYKRYVSGLFPPSCRFEPTCSAYMAEAVELHGAVKGVGLGLLRLLRCNPLFKGGYDPVPAPKAKRAPKSVIGGK